MPVAHQAGDWFADVRAQGVARVAQAFGLELGGPERARWLKPCPACGAGTRHPKRGDKRGAVGVSKEGLGWACFECEAKGDAVTLAALGVTSAIPAKGDKRWADVRRACAERGWCDADPRDGRPAPAVRLVKPPPMPAPAPPKRPPAAEVSALWAACVPVLDDPEVAAWLRDARGLDAGGVELWDLARALPRGLPLPRWARFLGSPWNGAAQGFRVLLPMFDAAGRLASLHARALTPQADNGSDKTAAPAGAELRGLVLANPLGRLLLAGAPLGDGSSTAELVARVGLVVAEGDPDFLTLATWWGDANEDAPAVLGVVAGSWREDSADLAAKVPDGCRVRLYTDLDKTGDGYAAAIYRSLRDRANAGRLSVERWNPGGAT